MTPFFDTHTHMIWGLNHGPQEQEMALCMLSRSYDQGARRIMLTPHSDEFRNNSKTIRENYQAMKAMLRSFSDVLPDLQVGLGCEVLCEAAAIGEIIGHLKNGRFPTLNGSNHVLAEFAPGASLKDIWHCVNALLEAGFVPVIAHIERYDVLRGNTHEVGWLRKAGCRIQLNTSSLHFSEPNCWWAQELVRKELVDFLGTDAHNTYSFPPRIREELESLRSICSREYLEKIAFRNARILW